MNSYNTVNGWPVRVVPNSIGRSNFERRIRYPIICRDSNGNVVIVSRCCRRCSIASNVLVGGRVPITVINAGRV